MAFGLGVVVDDSWSDGDRAKTGALDADWWSSSSTGGNSLTDGTPGLLEMVTGTSGRGLHATFTPQNLAIGQSIVATVTFTTPLTIGGPSNAGGAFRFAMMDGSDPNLAADLSSSSSSVNPVYTNLPGYMVDFDINTDSTADTSFRKHITPNTTGRFLGTTTEWDQIGTGPDDGYTFSASTEYVVVLSVTRTGADSVDIFGSLSDGTGLLSSHTVEDASAIANNFGMLGIWANSNMFGSNTNPSNPDNGIDLTNARIEVIPEPSTLALLLGAMVLGVLRRRK
jgi:hypothetical protein